MTADPRTLVVDHLNHYSAKVHHVYDGDTVFCLIWDPVISIYVLGGVRIRGVQAPEMTEPGGPDVKAAMTEKVPVNSTVVVGELGPYPRPGHVTAALTLQDGSDVASWLLDCGFAVRWDGQGKRPTVPWPPPALP